MISNYSSNNKSVVDLTLKNHYQYCSKFNIDFIYTIGKYSPYNNTYQIEVLLKLYNSVITVGTDILFTNFEKDIRDYIDYDYSIIVQQQRQNAGVNGDFIMWNNTSTTLINLDLLEHDKNKYWSTQAELDHLSSKLNIKILKPRSIQSINPNAYNGAQAQWKQGDFSCHFHRPNFAPKTNDKVNDIMNFVKEHNEIIH